MTVKEFLLRFRDEIKENEANITYEKWHSDFLKKTSSFHKIVKQAYFEQANKIIEDATYDDYYDNLSEFAYLGLFDENDEFKFSDLIKKLTFKLNKIDSEYEMERILSFLYTFMDFILHEYYPENELSKSIRILKLKINETNKLDSQNTGELVIRFIDLMV